MRDLFPCLRLRETNAADTFDLLYALIGLWFFRRSFHQHDLLRVFGWRRWTAAR
jgi:hypothetical protein